MIEIKDFSKIYNNEKKKESGKNNEEYYRSK